MNKAEFIQRFMLKPATNNQGGYKFHGSLKQAGVLIGLVESQQGLQVLLTQRASHLRHHAGQISFPGGRYEETDGSVVTTALREAQEEIALDPALPNIIGQLAPRQTISGYQVTPIVALLPEQLSLEPDCNEVADIFQVPLTHFLDKSNHQSVMVQHGKSQHPVYFMPYLAYNIWGATAAMLKDLVDHIS